MIAETTFVSVTPLTQRGERYMTTTHGAIKGEPAVHFRSGAGLTVRPAGKALVLCATQESLLVNFTVNRFATPAP